MTDPSNPTYQIAQSMPNPETPPDHPFQRAGPDFCDHVIYVHTESGRPVVCGLKKSQHPPPLTPNSPPQDEARDT